MTDEQIDTIAQPFLQLGDGDTEHDSIDWRGFARALLSASKPAARTDLSDDQRQAILHQSRLYLDDESGKYNARAVLTRIFSIAASPAVVLDDERVAFEAHMRSRDETYLFRRDTPGSTRLGQYCRQAVQDQWETWQARAASPQATATQLAQTERALTMSADELEEFALVAEDFEDDGETSTDYETLMDWAQRGLLECTHFEVTKAGAALLTAAQPASGDKA